MAPKVLRVGGGARLSKIIVHACLKTQLFAGVTGALYVFALHVDYACVHVRIAAGTYYVSCLNLCEDRKWLPFALEGQDVSTATQLQHLHGVGVQSG